MHARLSVLNVEDSLGGRVLTYQISKRVFQSPSGKVPLFPALGRVNFNLAPPSPFGTSSVGRTCYGESAVKFDLHTGKLVLENLTPVVPIERTFEDSPYTISMVGNVLTMTAMFNSTDELTQVIESFYFLIPPLLSVDFTEPPFVERVDGSIGDVDFSWIIQCTPGITVIPTTKEKQEDLIEKAWRRTKFFSGNRNRRLFAALHYYLVAQRLEYSGATAGEFLSEMILNLCKVLEVLFPERKSIKSMESSRIGLRILGFTEDEIAADYIPAIALRNGIDVGHVDLCTFSRYELDLIQGYVERSKTTFRRLLIRILRKLEQNEYTIAAYDDSKGRDKDKAKTILKHFEKYKDINLNPNNGPPKWD